MPLFYTIFTLVNEGTDVVQRSQHTPEHCAAITPVPLNHHQSSFLQLFHVIATPAQLQHEPQLIYG